MRAQAMTAADSPKAGRGHTNEVGGVLQACCEDTHGSPLVNLSDSRPAEGQPAHPEVPLATLAMMCRRARFFDDDADIPHFDPSQTQLIPPLPPLTALRLIDGLPPIVDDELEAAERWRARATVEGLVAKDVAEQWKVVFYVRGDEPPPQPLEIFHAQARPR